MLLWSSLLRELPRGGAPCFDRSDPKFRLALLASETIDCIVAHWDWRRFKEGIKH